MTTLRCDGFEGSWGRLLEKSDALEEGRGLDVLRASEARTITAYGPSRTELAR